jgi:hypothetical protein
MSKKKQTQKSKAEGVVEPMPEKEQEDVQGKAENQPETDQASVGLEPCVNPYSEVTGPGIMMSNNDVIPITDGDFKRLQQRMNMGGVIEGAYSIDNGMIISLAKIVYLMPDTKMID